jgi:hypothetical protein
MKQYVCGHTQPLFRAGHNRGITCMSKPKALRLMLIIMEHKYIIILQQNKLYLKALKYLRQLNIGAY